MKKAIKLLKYDDGHTCCKCGNEIQKYMSYYLESLPRSPINVKSQHMFDSKLDAYIPAVVSDKQTNYFCYWCWENVKMMNKDRIIECFGG